MMAGGPSVQDALLLLAAANSRAAEGGPWNGRLPNGNAGSGRRDDMPSLVTFNRHDAFDSDASASGSPEAVIVQMARRQGGQRATQEYYSSDAGDSDSSGGHPTGRHGGVEGYHAVPSGNAADGFAGKRWQSPQVKVQSPTMALQMVPQIITTRGALDKVGNKCVWDDSLLSLGTKELNEMLRQGNFKTQEVLRFKAARRRAKNRTYALRSRQKKGGRYQTPCPGPLFEKQGSNDGDGDGDGNGNASEDDGRVPQEIAEFFVDVGVGRKGKAAKRKRPSRERSENAVTAF